MRIAIISDTHFGDPVSTLVTRKDGKFALGSKYAESNRSKTAIRHGRTCIPRPHPRARRGTTPA